MLAFIALCAAIWIGFHLGAGYVAHRLPLAWLAALPVVGASYGWEREGRLYERLGIRLWKDWLPEAGAFFSGGFSKRRLDSREPDYLERFALETCRAEASHWLTGALALTFLLWTPWPVAALMVVYGAVVNGPFILVQRYNRARLRRVIARSARGRARCVSG